MSDYQALLAVPDSVGDEELAHIEDVINQVGITHLEDSDGVIRRIAGHLNKKTIPLANEDGNGPTRLSFGKVKTLGTIEEDEPEPAGHAGRAHAVLSASSALSTS